MTNLEKIIDMATDVLGDDAKAEEWVDHTSATLGGTPRDLSETQEGTDKVLRHLGDISRHSLT